MSKKIYRQGDVLLREAAEAPKGERVAENRIVLATGEATGHAHILFGVATEIRTEDARCVVVDEPSVLKHPEHDPIYVAPGIYWVVRQQEYSPEEVKEIFD